MRRSRDSLDTILHEREEGVGAESPVGDLSRDAGPQAENYFGSTPNKPAYGFKIALVAASRKVEKPANVVTVGLPVGERDGDPEGCSSFDEQQLGVLSKREELSGERGSELGAVRNQEGDGTIALEDQKDSVAVENRLSETHCESGISESGLDQVCQGERAVVPISSCEAVDGNGEKASAVQDTHLPDRKEQYTERLPSADKTGVTNDHLTDGEQLSSAVEGKLDHADGTGIQESVTENASVRNAQEQESKTEDVNETDADQHSVDREESNAIDEASKSDHIGEIESQETLTENASVTDSKQQTSETQDANENDVNQHSVAREKSNTIDEASKSDHTDETESQESLTENASVTDSKQQTSETEDVNENDTNHYSFDREETNAMDKARKSDHIGAETEARESLRENAFVKDTKQQTSETEDVNENDTNHYSFDREETKAMNEARKSDHIGAETETQESSTESTFVSNSHGQKSEDEAVDIMSSRIQPAERN